MIKDNIARIKKDIGGYPGITVVAISKGRAPEQIREVVAAGIIDIGENRVQEALGKYQELAALCNIRWHMVGHLQTNKVKEAVRIFDLIHSVDSLRLAGEVDKQAEKINKIQDILIEVNISKEESKFGIKPEELSGLVNSVSVLKNVRLSGLMTVAPVADNPEDARPYFRLLRELKEQIKGLNVLSMGMSGDFRVAVEEGANILRLGRAIFEG